MHQNLFLASPETGPSKFRRTAKLNSNRNQSPLDRRTRHSTLIDGCTYGKGKLRI